VVTTDSAHGLKVYPNLAASMTISGVKQLWVAEITYIRWAEEFVYLAVILDAYSRRVIGWRLDDSLPDSLTIAALPKPSDPAHESIPSSSPPTCPAATDGTWIPWLPHARKAPMEGMTAVSLPIFTESAVPSRTLVTRASAKMGCTCACCWECPLPVGNKSCTYPASIGKIPARRPVVPHERACLVQKTEVATNLEGDCAATWFHRLTQRNPPLRAHLTKAGFYSGKFGCNRLT